MSSPLAARAAGHCELCGHDGPLTAYAVPPHSTPSPEHGAMLCSTCHPQVAGEAELDPNHWFCLQGTAWSEHAPIQVLAWRLLQQLRSHSWAADLADQLWLDDETRAWAEAAPVEADDATPVTRDSNGTVLASGDSVSLIKSLDVKGAGFTAKRGTTVRNIRLTDDPTHIEGRVNGVSIYLKTCFLKKMG